MSMRLLTPLHPEHAEYEISVGWDPVLATFYFIVLPDKDGECDPLLWEESYKEHPGLASLEPIIAPYATLDSTVRALLLRDRDCEGDRSAQLVLR
jgi:hypothetical protein